MVKQSLDPRLKTHIEEDALDTQGFERPHALMQAVEEDLVPLLELAHRPVISAHQFSRDHLVQLSRLAARFETQPSIISRPLTGKILISAFYEPSTRTRLSFESAWHRLGGDIMSITDPASTGIAKGESLFDVGEMLNHYGDMVVLRDSNKEAVYEMLEALRIPIVNAGNGLDEHPTQAMADIYTILKWQPGLMAKEPNCQIRIGIIGVPSRMRTVRSLLIYLAQFSKGIAEVVIIADNNTSEVFDPDQREELEKEGLKLSVTSNMEQILPSLDVVYINAIAWTGDSYESHGSKYALSADSNFKPNAIVMHPLARGAELDRSLDDTPHNWYFAQARGAVFIRMALLSAMLKTFS
ncbi:MAG: aspartate carbamoyltransferase [Candidatus Thiodiazotropha sp.]|jgi:aspartate carbamoyltransferase catalytic subunit